MCFHSRFCKKQAGFTLFLHELWQHLLQGSAFFSFSDCRASKANRSADGFSWRFFRFLGPGSGVILDLPARGNSHLVLPYLERQGPSISRWCRPRPLAAGAFFAVAFGNRTELILTLPVFLYFLSATPVSDNRPRVAKAKQWLRENWRPLTDFMLLPLTLGILTAGYNFARFGSFFDFGYARIPGVLREPWYQHGLFSLHAIPWNVHKMLFEGFGDRPTFPYLRLYPFGCSIFLSSPFLFLIFREGGRYKRACWLVIAVLTFILWTHGNPGGWQFSYRYAIILLPWMFLLLVGNGPAKISVIEVSLFAVSVAINAIATWQFLWTNEIHP